MFHIFSVYSDALLEGLKFTIFASLIALVSSLIIGTLMAILQVSSHKIVKRLTTIYVEFFKNIPLLLIVMFFYVVAPLYLFQVDGFTAGTIGLTLYTSAFIAETVRAGIEGIPKGQLEAGLSSGLSYTQVMWYIILPQAFKIVIPPLGNQFINLVKNSSILAMVAGLDLMYQGDLIASETFNTFDTYLLVGGIYLLLTLPVSYLMRYIEKRLETSH